MKSSTKWLIALAGLGAALYFINKTAKSVSKMIDDRKVPTTSQKIDVINSADKRPFFPTIREPTPEELKEMNEFIKRHKLQQGKGGMILE